MSKEQKYNELHEVLKKQLRGHREACAKGADNAGQMILLATHALNEYTAGSPWSIAEQAMLDAYRNAHQVERENARVFEKAIQDLEELDW